jgi:hypothetical protein
MSGGAGVTAKASPQDVASSHGLAPPRMPTERSMLIDDPGAVRRTVRSLLTRSARADLAIRRLRLAALRFEGGELERVHVRLLVGRLDVDAVAGAPGTAVFGDRRKAELERLREVVRAGRVQVRTAGMVRWDPDFSVFRQSRAGGGLVLLGSHRFDVPDPGSVKPLCAGLRGERRVALAAERFEGLWAGGYDVGPVVEDLLDWLLGPSGEVLAEPGGVPIGHARAPHAVRAGGPPPA